MRISIKLLQACTLTVAIAACGGGSPGSSSTGNTPGNTVFSANVKSVIATNRETGVEQSIEIIDVETATITVME